MAAPQPRAAFYPPFIGTSSFPTPLTPPHFLPLTPHPGNRAPPAPARPPLPPPPAGWTRSFHAIPAAYPRQLREAHGPHSRASHPYRDETSAETEAALTSEERRARANAEAKRVAEARWGAHEWTIEEGLAAKPEGQFLAVERWRRDVPRGGRTLVCTHANGMQKEHWQPVLREIIEREGGVPDFVFGTNLPLAATPVVLDDIWMLDDMMHGASVDLNAGKLGTAQVWDDTARDLLNFVVHVLPGIKASEARKTKGVDTWQLPWLPADAVPPARVIGFGASFGGTAQVGAAHAAPDRFDGVFLADPMVPPRVRTWEMVNTPRGIEETIFRVRNALKRRASWPTRAAAREALGKLPFYQAFDPRTFDLVISHGLVPADPSRPDGEVTLATPPWAEAAVFCESVATARAWDKLPHIPVPLAFYMAKTAERTMGDAVTQEIVWRAPLARNERSVTAEHLLVQENPSETAQVAQRFLATLEAGQWGGSSGEIRASYDEGSKARL